MKTHGLELRIPPLIVLAIAGLSMWLIARALPELIFMYAGRIALGVGLALLGGAAMLAGVFEFRKARTTVDPRTPDRSTFIVTSGIYRFTRNPMYLGMLVVLLGWGAYISNVAALVVPVLFAIYITRYQIRPEERILVEQFGAPYEVYLRSVRRWV